MRCLLLNIPKPWSPAFCGPYEEKGFVTIFPFIALSIFFLIRNVSERRPNPEAVNKPDRIANDSDLVPNISNKERTKITPNNATYIDPDHKSLFVGRSLYRIS